MPPAGTKSAAKAPDRRQLDFWGQLWSPSGAATTVNPTAGSFVEEVRLESGSVRVIYARHPRARRYRLIFHRDGGARCTVPPRGTMAEARRFVAANHQWLAKQLKRHEERAAERQTWALGDNVWFNGEAYPIKALQDPSNPAAHIIMLGPICTEAPNPIPDDLRRLLEWAMRRHAEEVLPVRTAEFAAAHGLKERLKRVSVRNQKTRWGSCSRRGVVSLNWRLVQLPEAVRDYILHHELAHLVHLNHGVRFWALVERFCPGYRAAEAWLRKSGRHVF
jgi:predicted metal-dependent hydrolase